MYQVFNTLTNTPEAVLSETPYELAGPLAERRYEQKKDGQGNLLYLRSVEKVSEENGLVVFTGVFEYEEATEAVTVVAITDYETGELTLSSRPNTPVMIDAGPMYEWREVIPTPADIAAETQRAFVAAVQNHLDAAARQYGYDDIKSAVTYAEEPAVPKFQAEGKAFRAWRSLTWAACYAILADVLAGTRSVPTADELLAELPALEVE